MRSSSSAKADDPVFREAKIFDELHVLLDALPSRSMTENLNASNARIQVVPIGIEFFDQSDLPSSIVLFQLLLASDRIFRILELFEINEHVDFVFLGKAF